MTFKCRFFALAMAKNQRREEELLINLIFFCSVPSNPQNGVLLKCGVFSCFPYFIENLENIENY